MAFAERPLLAEAVWKHIRRKYAERGPLIALVVQLLRPLMRASDRCLLAIEVTQRGSRPRQPHRLHRSRNTQDADHPLEVVSQHVQAHFGVHVRQGLGEEVR